MAEPKTTFESRVVSMSLALVRPIHVGRNVYWLLALAFLLGFVVGANLWAGIATR